MGFFEYAFNSLNESIFIHDGTDIVWCNDELVALLNYESTSDLIGKPVLSFARAEDRTNASNSIERIQREGRSGGIYRAKAGDGTFISIRTSGGVYRHRGRTYYVGVVRQIDEIEVEERMKHFVATLKHETNTPLSNALGRIEFIQTAYAEQLDPEVKKMLDTAHENLKRIEASFNKVRELEKLGT